MLTGSQPRQHLEFTVRLVYNTYVYSTNSNSIFGQNYMLPKYTSKTCDMSAVLSLSTTRTTMMMMMTTTTTITTLTISSV